MDAEPVSEQLPVNIERDFDYLLSFLPCGWKAQARSCGALRRCRKIPDAPVLLRALLLHLAEGCSLRETAVRLKEGGIIDISDVAIMDRLRQSAKWFNWMNSRMLEMWIARKPAEVFGFGRKILVADGTRIQEQGPTGSATGPMEKSPESRIRCPQAPMSSQGSHSTTCHYFTRAERHSICLPIYARSEICRSEIGRWGLHFRNEKSQGGSAL
jgi:hypothetical protein